MDRIKDREKFFLTLDNSVLHLSFPSPSDKFTVDELGFWKLVEAFLLSPATPFSRRIEQAFRTERRIFSLPFEAFFPFSGHEFTYL